jgi:hypothetical protein
MLCRIGGTIRGSCILVVLHALLIVGSLLLHMFQTPTTFWSMQGHDKIKSPPAEDPERAAHPQAGQQQLPQPEALHTLPASGTTKRLLSLPEAQRQRPPPQQQNAAATPQQHETPQPPRASASGSGALVQAACSRLEEAPAEGTAAIQEACSGQAAASKGSSGCQEAPAAAGPICKEAPAAKRSRTVSQTALSTVSQTAAVQHTAAPCQQEPPGGTAALYTEDREGPAAGALISQEAAAKDGCGGQSAAPFKAGLTEQQPPAEAACATDAAQDQGGPAMQEVLEAPACHLLSSPELMQPSGGQRALVRCSLLRAVSMLGECICSASIICFP